MPKQWNRTSENLLPPEGRVVLLNIEKSQSMPACVVAGYVKKYSNGQHYFVTPGANIKHSEREVMYWSDCLGDDFQCPLWANKTINKTNS